MSGLVLRLGAAPVSALDLSPLTPDRLAGMPVDAIARLQLNDGGRRVRLDKLFEIEGAPGDTLRLGGLHSGCLRVGAGMTGGRLEVSGNCGAAAGSEMQGGELRLAGNAGDDLGSGMRGGLIHVRGNAGNRVGGAVTGSVRGMNEGCIVIDGNSGAATGERMRRGVILVGGDCGPRTGTRMIAGTIIVLGRPGPDCGLGLRRGTLLLGQAPQRMPAGFNDCGEYKPGFLRMLAAYLRPHARRHAARLDAAVRVRRYCGDLAHGGLGEMLVMNGGNAP